MIEFPVPLLFFGLLFPPMVAFVYSAGVLGMYAGFHEWTLAEKGPALVSRFALLGGAASITYSDRYANAYGTDISDEKRILMLAVQSALMWVLGIFFCFETRYEDVVGGRNPSNKLDETALQHKTVMITGSNAGIGKETAKQLAALGASTIILACRSPKRGQEAMEDLKKYQTKKTKTQYIVLECDLGSFDSVRQAVKTLKDRQQQSKDIPQIDVLVLNAGVMMNDQVMTEDGCETMMQANLLGHFLLTRLLLAQKLIKPNKKAPPRVLHLTSSTYQIAIQGHGGMDLEDMMCDKKKRKYALFGQYGQSKLGNILFAKELARRYPDQLVSLAIHPGIVRTDVTRNMPAILRIPNQVFGSIVQCLQKTVPQGAWCSVSGATSPVDMTAMSSWELDSGTGSEAEEVKETEETEKVDKGIPNGSYLQNGKVRLTDAYTYEEAVSLLLSQ